MMMALSRQNMAVLSGSQQGNRPLSCLLLECFQSSQFITSSNILQIYFRVLLHFKNKIFCSIRRYCLQVKISIHIYFQFHNVWGDIGNSSKKSVLDLLIFKSYLLANSTVSRTVRDFVSKTKQKNQL